LRTEGATWEVGFEKLSKSKSPKSLLFDSTFVDAAKEPKSEKGSVSVFL
jgi:hypothetical protein